MTPCSIKEFSARLLDLAGSLKAAVYILLLFMVIVFAGTLYQVDRGLHEALDHFFYSWLTPPISGWYTPDSPDAGSRFIRWLVLPLPGGLMVMWALAINLTLSMVRHFRYGWRQSGSVLAHVGILLMLGGGWAIYLTAEEGFLSLPEGESSDTALSLQEWEIALWQEHPDGEPGETFSAEGLKSGDVLHVDALDLELAIHAYHRNALAFGDGEHPQEEGAVLSVIGVQRIESGPETGDPQTFIPGARITARRGRQAPQHIILTGGDPLPLVMHVDGSEWFLQLRRRHIPLPIRVQLVEFRKEYEPNTRIARHFSSRILVSSDGVERPVLIEMNRPFRYEEFTFFQSSYGEAEDGRDISTFAVTRNRFMLAPYWATGLTTVGLILHFLIRMMPARRPRKGEAS